MKVKVSEEEDIVIKEDTQEQRASESGKGREKCASDRVYHRLIAQNEKYNKGKLKSGGNSIQHF